MLCVSQPDEEVTEDELIIFLAAGKVAGCVSLVGATGKSSVFAKSGTISYVPHET